MSKHVLFQLGILRSFVLAFRAGERSLTHMRSYVSNQRCSLSGSIIAVVTTERFNLGMDQDMLVHVRFLGAFESADIAGMRFFTCMCEHMFFYIVSAGESSMAHGARVYFGIFYVAVCQLGFFPSSPLLSAVLDGPHIRVETPFRRQ